MNSYGYWQFKAEPGLFQIKSFHQVLNQEISVHSFSWKFFPLKIHLIGEEEICYEDIDKAHIFVVASGRLSKIMMLSALKHSTNSSLNFCFSKIIFLLHSKIPFLKWQKNTPLNFNLWVHVATLASTPT
jgi:hypothetical protein